jgi:hypothetical protein
MINLIKPILIILFTSCSLLSLKASDNSSNSLLTSSQAYDQIENKQNQNEEESEVISEEVTEEADLDETSPELQSAEVESDKYLTITPYLQYKTRQVQQGVEISKGKPTTTIGVDLFHYWGLNLSLSRTSVFEKTLPYLSTNFGLGYEYEISSWLSTGINYSSVKYSSDTVNSIANANNSFGVFIDFNFHPVIIDLSYSRKFGTSNINDLGLSLISIIKLSESFKLLPILSSTYTSYEITKKKLVLENGKIKLNNVTKTSSGISSINASLKLGYNITKKLTLSLTPSYSYTPIKELSEKSQQAYITLNLDYDFDIIF